MGGGSIGEWRPRGIRARALGALLLACAACACGRAPALAGARFSLLAVGDAGAPPRELDHYEIARDVARAMAAEDRAHPVNGLVLLGDNFYPRGLLAEELEPRLYANLALPFCRFLELDAQRARWIASACPTPEAERHPVPVYALLGNHDYRSPESPRLQREAVPGFVHNWRMVDGPAGVVELGDGVSLVVFDSDPVFRGASAAPLADALRRAEGPWRVVAAHHPLALSRRDRPEREREYAAYAERVLGALRAAGVPVQLFLAAHEHNLQLLAMEPPAPALHVVAGGGSSGRSLAGPEPRRRAGFASPGFARIDLVGEGGDQRLVASLWRVGGWRIGSAGTPAARASVDLAGRVRSD